MTMLPDVPEDEYRKYLSDQFSKGATDQINALADPPASLPSFIAPDQPTTSAPEPLPSDATAAPIPSASPTAVSDVVAQNQPAPAAQPSSMPSFIAADDSSASAPRTTSSVFPDTGYRSAGMPAFIPADSSSTDSASAAAPTTTSSVFPDTGWRSMPSFIPADSSSPSATVGDLGPIDATSQQSFVNSIKPYADKWSQITGIPSSYLTAWAASESNWGKAGNALFGIKQASAPGTKPGLTSGTWEQGQGAITDTFADYNSPNEAFAALDDFLQGKRYQDAYRQLRSGQISPDEFMQSINASGYATDPIWGKKVASIAHNTIEPMVGTGAQGVTPSESLERIGGWAVPTADRVSQFGDQQLSTDEAYAACGPAAAVRFAQAYGRNPTLREAVDLAKGVGWTAQNGMAGISSEQQLLSKMGIPTKLTNDISAMAKEAQTGNPVTISTPGHYFYADGYDPGTGAFHVGRSGTDLKGGSEWMTPAQMEAVMGKIQGGLLADNPTVPGQSTAQNVSDQVGGFFSGVGTAVRSGVDTAARAVEPVTRPIQDAIGGAVGGVGALGDQAVTALNQAVTDAHNNQQSQLPGGAFNRLAPGSEGGPPQYTDFGQAAAASGPTPADVYTVKPGEVQAVLDQIASAPGLSNVIQWQQQQAQQGRDTLTQAGLNPDAGIFSNKPEVDPLGVLTTAPGQILSGPQQGNWGLGGTLGGALALAGLGMAGQTPAGSSGAAARAAEAALAEFERQFPPEVAHAATVGSDVFGAGGAQPTTGASLLKRAMDALGSYPEEIAAPIRDFVATVDAPASQIASTVMRWIVDNPLHAVPDVSAGPAARVAAADVGEQAVREMTDSVASRGPAYRPGGPGPEPGQLELESLPVVGSPETGRLAPASREVTDWLKQAIEGRSGQEPLPAGSGPGGVPSVTPGKVTPYQRAFPEADSGPGGLIGQVLEAARAARSGENLPRGVTQDMVDAAHVKLDNLTNAAGEKVAIPMGTHDVLDRMLASGATPADLGRFFANLAGDKPTIADWIRALRTGSMAGGLTTEGKVLAGPIIQTAMRAPAGALHLIMTGRASEIPAGLRGGLSGLAEGAHEALQTIRYGTNYRSVLSGGAGGGYGFRPGPSMIAGSPYQRALATVLEGLVRTHGAAGDISAGIGRGANTALRATPEQAAEAGQQWAFRSGEYGWFGSRMARVFDALRSRNPGFDVMSQLIVPFYRVAYNVFTQGVERSPVGLLGRVADRMQGKPLDQAKLANNLFGVGLASLAFTEAAQGNITSEHPEGGAPKNSIRLAGHWFPLRVLGPLSEPLAQAAITYESARDSRGNTAKFAMQLGSSYLGHVEDETWLSSLHDVLDTIGAARNLGNPDAGTASKAEKDIGYLGKSYGKSFIPQEKLGEQILGLGKLASSGGASSERPPGALPVYKPGSGSSSLPVYKPSSFPKVGAGR